jgi:lipopolysaccharide export LptBFGC system permease protein LptF
LPTCAPAWSTGPAPGSPRGRVRIYTLPVIIFGFAFVLVLAILTDLPPWMVGLAAVLALFGYLLERRKSP